MKKIYSKLTKERDSQYQIETAVYIKENGEKIVEKTSLTSDSETHVNHIYEVFEKFQKDGKNYFLSCEKSERGVCFPFLSGSSLYKKIIEAAEKENKNEILRIFEKYRKLIQNIYDKTEKFAYSDEFRKIFGEIENLENQSAGKMVDIDLTFDNIIVENQAIQIIDYEWTFEFPVPVKFPIYRAIFALWVKHAQLFMKMFSEDELYECFDISVEERDIFKQMNNNFMKFVEGNDNSYVEMLNAYKKPEEVIGKEKNPEEYALVFWGNNGDYTMERQQTYFADHTRKFRLVVNIDQYEETDSIRIDPWNKAAFIDVKTFEVETEEKIRKFDKDEYISNVTFVQESKWLFKGEDPQIMVDIPHKKGWKKIIFEYEVLQDNLNNLDIFIKEIQNHDKKELQKMQKRLQEVETLAEGQARLLNQSAHKLAEYENTIQLLKDKLAYIEGTKAYQTLLKSKVEKINLWDSIK